MQMRAGESARHLWTNYEPTNTIIEFGTEALSRGMCHLTVVPTDLTVAWEAEVQHCSPSRHLSGLVPKF
jgi:hypothetical protein